MRMPRGVSRRLALTLGPALALAALGALQPEWALFFVGAGLGWIVVAPLVLRGGAQMTYREAVRHLRRDRLPEAIAAMDALIAAEPDDAAHWRFRAELRRMAGQLDRARQDYEHAARLDPEGAEAFFGLAELCMQQGRYDEARDYAGQAAGRDPSHWVPPYDLGLIADREGDASAAVAHLERALRAGLPDRRYRLLTHVLLARNHYRMGQVEAARDQVTQLRRQAGALKEWRVIFASEQAAPLRAMLAPDVALAERLIAGEPLEVLGAPAPDRPATSAG